MTKGSTLNAYLGDTENNAATSNSLAQQNKESMATNVMWEAPEEEGTTSPGDTTVSTAGGNFQYYKYVHFDLIKI